MPRPPEPAPRSDLSDLASRAVTTASRGPDLSSSAEAPAEEKSGGRRRTLERLLPLAAWAAAILLLLAAAYWVFRAAGDSDRREQPVTTFVHATDPHLFLERKYTEGSNRVEPNSAQRQWQERLDREALRAMLTTVGNLPSGERPEFILFTGDWGIDTTSGKTTQTGRSVTAPEEAPRGSTETPTTAAGTGAEATEGPRGSTETTTAAAGTEGAESPPTASAQDTSAQDTSTSPAVPAAAARDSVAAAAPAGGPAGAAPDQRWAEQADSVAALLSASPIRTIYWVPGNNDIAGESSKLDSLALADEFNALVAQRLRNGVTLQNLTACYTGRGSCSVDVPDTRFALVGVPTVSFKKSPTAADTAAQEAVLARTSALTAAEAARGRRVLLATHIPEMDDPYNRGQVLYAGSSGRGSTLAASAWNVSDSAFAAWKRLVESRSVAAVLAGHFHDSHREVYSQPYRWAESSELRADPGKLLLAPPLSVKNQEASPYQARGFTLVRIFEDDEVERQIYWLDPTTGAFVPEADTDSGRRRDGVARRRNGCGLLWLRCMDEGGESINQSARDALYWVALLLAFLVVAALWKVPAPRESTVVVKQTADGQTVTTPAADDSDSVFKSNLGRTLASGLTGIAAVTLLKDVLGTSGTTGQAYFAVVFIRWFLLLLFLSALLRGIIESLKSRVSVEHRPPVAVGGRRRWDRFWLWFLSLNPTLLVFLDTFTNVLFGRSWAQSVVWENQFTQTQEVLLSAIDRIREEVSGAVGDALRAQGYAATDERDYRVNVSLLSTQVDEAFYLSAARTAATKFFGKKSVAYLSMRTGQARWWKRSYQGDAVHLRSALRLQTPGDAPLSPRTRLSRVSAVGPEGNSDPLARKRAQLVHLTVAAVLADGSTLDISRNVRIRTVGELLKALNAPGAFRRGLRPGVMSLDTDGFLLLSVPGVKPSAPAGAGTAGGADGAAGGETGAKEPEHPLRVTHLAINGISLGPFTEIPMPDPVLHHDDPAKPVFNVPQHKVMLSDYFQDRGVLDYEAFVVIPIPWAQRGLTRDTRRGALHISFSRAYYLDALWRGLEGSTSSDRPLVLRPNYESQQYLLHDRMLSDRTLRAVLGPAVRVLAELIREVNETWYRHRYSHPRVKRITVTETEE